MSKQIVIAGCAGFIVIKDELLDGSFFSYQFAFVIQFAFAHMGTMTNMNFAGSAVFAQRNFLCFVVRPSLGAPLLGVPPFRIRHMFRF